MSCLFFNHCLAFAQNSQGGKESKGNLKYPFLSSLNVMLFDGIFASIIFQTDPDTHETKKKQKNG